jgi:hypothetical protein
MTLFWHNHFATSQQKVRSLQLMYRQNALLRREALGNFATLLRGIAKDPAMLVYLDNAGNRRQAPNENFAREVMELFTLGEGHYTEHDIKEAARAFTGWSLDRESGDFTYRRMWHDFGEKTVFGRTARMDGDDVIDLLLARAETAQFIVAKVWREFVSPTPQPAEVTRWAGVLRDARYEMKPLLRAVLMSDAFWSDAHRGALVKSPVELVAGTLRTFEIHPADLRPAVFACAALGQNLFSPPNVKGWPGGEAWIDSSTLLARQQFIDRVFRGSDPMATTVAMRTPAPVQGQGGAAVRRMLERGMADYVFDADRFGGALGAKGGARLQSLVLAYPPVGAMPEEAPVGDRVRALVADVLLPAQMTYGRRDFLRLAALAPLAGSSAFAAALAGPARKLLVLVELRGGNDGLNTVIPFNDPRYAALRPRIAIPREQVVQLTQDAGLHPSLEKLRALWDARELAIVQGVGYPQPNLSHFRSIEIWDTASRSDEYLDAGWLARAFSRSPSPASFAADGVVVGSGSMGPLAGGSARCIALTDPAQFLRNARLARGEGEATNAALAHILRVQRDVRASAEKITAERRFETPFPAGAFGNSVNTAAQLAANEAGVSVVRLSLGSFDTHANQLGPARQPAAPARGGLVRPARSAPRERPLEPDGDRHVRGIRPPCPRKPERRHRPRHRRGPFHPGGRGERRPLWGRARAGSPGWRGQPAPCRGLSRLLCDLPRALVGRRFQAGPGRPFRYLADPLKYFKSHRQVIESPSC